MYANPDPPAATAGLRDMTRGNEARHRALRQALARLATGAAGDDLQEMAQEVLAGRITLRQAMHSCAYAEAWYTHVERLIRVTAAGRHAEGFPPPP